MILSEAKNYLNSPIIDSYETSEEITNKILLITKNCLRDCESLYSCCRKIKETIDSELIGSWNCIAFYKNIGSHYHLRNSSFVLDIKFGKLSFNIYKVFDEV